MKSAAAFALIFGLLLIANLQAQELQDQTQKDAFLVVCDQTPGQIIVLDSNGSWVPNVKSVSISINVEGTAELICISYVGVIKPSNPKILKYKLAQIKSMGKPEFMTMIDGLQSDPAYVKNSNSFRASTTVRQPKPQSQPQPTPAKEEFDDTLSLGDN